MKNNEFIKAYVSGEITKGANGHCIIFKKSFVNYSTELCIIDRKNKSARLNTKKYPPTTGRIQSALRRELEAAGYDIEEYEGARARIWNFGYQGARRCKVDDIPTTIAMRELFGV